MKRITAVFISVCMMFSLTACAGQSRTDEPSASRTTAGNTAAEERKPEDTGAPAQVEPGETENASAAGQGNAEGKTLVVYYSSTGHTKEAAGYIASALGADLFELEPVEPYSSDDLNWRDENSRVTKEHNNLDTIRVELKETTVPDWDSYSNVFIGYPIWWGIAAWPVDGFIAANDFTGKNVVPFCTSSSSGLGESGQLLAEAAGTGNWLEGQRFPSSVTEADVKAWAEGLNLSVSAEKD